MANSKRDKSDYYTLEAKKRGYPARSIFKLSEIEKKFKIFKNSKKVLDIGAAPGSWTLFISREILKGNGEVVAVDLNPLSLSVRPENITEITGDAFSKKNLEKIIERGIFDTAVSDAAPHTTGNRFTDTSRSEELVKNMIELSDKVLKKGGNFVAKIFQGQETSNILKNLKTKYNKVCTFKPECSRNDSFETFIVCLDKKE